MSKTNCINCGAAKDTSELKCPFCGTTYLDFTAIDFESGEPVVCEFVLPNGSEDKYIMSMLAMPQLNTIENTYETTSFYGIGSPGFTNVVGNVSVNVGVSFRPIEHKGTLFTLRKK